MADNIVYHVVKDGETLTSIANKYKSQYSTTVDRLVLWNKDKYPSLAKDRDLICIGWKLAVSGEDTDTVETNGNTVTITGFGIQTNTKRTLLVTWSWDDKKNTENYEVVWSYYGGDKTFIGTKIWIDSKSNTSDGSTMFSTYNAPDNAEAVKVTVKPIPSTSTTVKWQGTACKAQEHWFDGTAASAPTGVSVSLTKLKLKSEVNGLSEDISHVEFWVIKNHNGEVYKKSGLIPVNTGYSVWSTTVAAGANYKVQCRSYKKDNDTYSEWYKYSDVVYTAPNPPTINSVNVVDENNIKLSWSSVQGAIAYAAQYVIKDDSVASDGISMDDYFDIPGVSPTTTDTIEVDAEYKDSTVTKLITGFTPGYVYYIRLMAATETTESQWSKAVSFTIGTEPTAPTTWSSTTTLVVGEPLKLYWLHNSEDNSNSTGAELLININGADYPYENIDLTSGSFKDSKWNLITIRKSDPEKDDDKTYICEVDTNSDLFDAGSTIKWKVRTAGVVVGKFGDWSMTRTVDIYEQPALAFDIYDVEGNMIDGTLTGLPFTVKAEVGNTINQKAIGYYVAITANESYETVDEIGNNKYVMSGSKVYSKYVDVNAVKTDDEKITVTANTMNLEITASDVDLLNNIRYTVACIVSMSSGLTDEDTGKQILVAWEEKSYTPFAEIGYNKDSITTFIRPYSNGGDDILLSVYRREFDGSFTELATEIQNGGREFIVDPHPALDYARYRVIAKSKTTGSISYNDIPGYLIGEKAAIIQWDEEWQPFDVSEETLGEYQSWSGSMLKLKYNIDVSDTHSPDKSLVEYIGRKHPVSYYGTQLGHSSSWSMEIPKSDVETLYAIRRLANWMGDVYVREPSGSGYWANITVSYRQKHCDVTIPITLNITRVEGGA